MNKLKLTSIYIILSIATLVSLFPFLWMLISMTNTSVDVSNGRLLPGTHLFENLASLFQNYNVGSALYNSFFIAIVATILCLIVSSLAGYGFEIYRSKGKDIVFNILLLSLMIPFAALMVPLFRFFGGVSQTIPFLGIDTLFAVILPYVTTAFFVFLFRQNTKMFAKELIEAGRIDGLSELGIFFYIYVPSMKNTFAAAGIISFMNNWNNFLWPLVILQSPDVQTIPLLISNLGSGYSPDFGVIYTAIVIGTIPTALVFFFLQKYFVEGMSGSVKG